MNFLHMKYAVEIAKTGSINKAAETLYVAQPNLSRAIKELETELNISIFERSSKGMVLTAQGENFIRYATNVLEQVEDIKKLCGEGAFDKQCFSISGPRASYISDAFAHFSKLLNGNPAEVYYQETNPAEVIKNVLENDYKLGIVRYSVSNEKYFEELFEEKGISYELITEFKYVVILNNANPLASKSTLTFDDLMPYVEIAHKDPYMPFLPMNVKEGQIDNAKRVIYLCERGSQFDILSENPETYMWVSPIPEKLLKRYNLSQIKCTDNVKTYKDVLIKKKEYKLTDIDSKFVAELVASKRKCF